VIPPSTGGRSRHGPFGITRQLSPDVGEPLHAAHRRDLLVGLLVVAADRGGDLAQVARACGRDDRGRVSGAKDQV
jgi:hypothetical protein